MIVDQFIQWVMTAAPAKRAKATHALARAYVGFHLNDDDRDAAEAAMTFLLDDPCDKVRHALVDALAGSEHAPRHIVMSYFHNDPKLGPLVAARSPLLGDGELVDAVAEGAPGFQMAIAGRTELSAALCAAIAEVACYDACIRMLANTGASLRAKTLLRLAERFGHDRDMQSILMEHGRMPVAGRQLILAHMSDALCQQAIDGAHLGLDRADDVAREARDRATLTLSRAITDVEELSELVEHLRDSEQLTTVLLLRALCAGQIDFFIEALVILADVSRKRVEALLSDRNGRAFRSLYSKASLPDEALTAFEIAIDVYHEEGAVLDPADQYRFTRTMIERILDQYRALHFDGVDDILAMLRRFASETARDAARTYVTMKQVSAA